MTIVVNLMEIAVTLMGNKIMAQRKGVCPVCGSHKVSYSASRQRGTDKEGEVSYDMICHECFFEGYETYTLVFKTQTDMKGNLAIPKNNK